MNKHYSCLFWYTQVILFKFTKGGYWNGVIKKQINMAHFRQTGMGLTSTSIKNDRFLGFHIHVVIWPSSSDPSVVPNHKIIYCSYVLNFVCLCVCGIQILEKCALLFKGVRSWAHIFLKYFSYYIKFRFHNTN